MLRFASRRFLLSFVAGFLAVGALLVGPFSFAQQSLNDLHLKLIGVIRSGDGAVRTVMSDLQDGSEPAGVQSAGTPVRGSLLIVGGGPLPEEIVDRFVELSGGPGRADIAIFPQASGYADAGIEFTADLEKRGAKAKRILVTRAEADREDAPTRLSGVTGIWFGGGDQSRLTAVLAGTRLAEAIHRLHENGAVIGGTSAGAAVMSDLMLTGDERFPGGSRSSSEDIGPSVTIGRGNVVLAEGLAFLPEAIVDQHFVRRRRHNRLISAVLESPGRLGVGIDESTALEVDIDGCWRVLGESVVVIYDARQAEVGSKDGASLGAADIRMHVLPAGGWFDPSTAGVRIPSYLK